MAHCLSVGEGLQQSLSQKQIKAPFIGAVEVPTYDVCCANVQIPLISAHGIGTALCTNMHNQTYTFQRVAMIARYRMTDHQGTK